jgi:hypothetical protein
MNKYIANDFQIFNALHINYADSLANANAVFEGEEAYQRISAAIEKYHQRFNLADAVVTDYLNKEISVQGGSIITSLRFRNLDINMPFVEIVYSSMPIGTHNIEKIIRTILDHYQTRSIRFIHFFSTETIAEPTLPGYTFVKYKVLFASRLSETTPSLNPLVTIQPAGSGDFYDRYAEEYEIFYREQTDNKIMAQAESREYIDFLVKEKKVFEISIGGKFSGIIAYDLKSIFSIKGIEIIEEFLFKEFRGNGKAKYAQGLLIQSVLKKREAPDWLLYGTIHYKNIPSIKTAVHNGRKPLGTWYQVNLQKK